MAKIIIELDKCIDNKKRIKCPYCYVERTPGTGYAVDHFCRLTNNKTSGYVEWESDINPVPNSCPLIFT